VIESYERDFGEMSRCGVRCTYLSIMMQRIGPDLQHHAGLPSRHAT
jgi:hypothetical protein